MVDSIARVPVRGTWVRHVPARIDPLVTQRRRTGGRFHRPGQLALYLADDEQTAWAEWYRALAERGQTPTDDMPRDLHKIAVVLDSVADLSSPTARKAAGLPARMSPTRSQWPKFQAIAARLIAEGAHGVLYGSAARSRSLCLCVFETGLAGLSIEDEPVRVLLPPAPPRGMRT